MSIDSGSVIVPGEGHFYIAPAGTTEPASNAAPTGDWVEVGHTSYDSPLTIRRDGGERTTLPSWQTAALRETVTPVTYALDFGLLQNDELANKLYYGGGAVVSGKFQVPKIAQAQEHALFIRIIDGADTWARFFSITSILGSDSEEADPEALMSKPVSATVLGDDELGYLFSIWLNEESSSSS